MTDQGKVSCICLSLRGHAFFFYGRGNLGFRFLGGVSRRVFIPPRLSEIASSAESRCLLAMTDQGRCLSSILSLRAHAFSFYGRGNLGFDVLGGVLRRVFIFERVKIPLSILSPEQQKDKNLLCFWWSIEEGQFTSSTE